MILLKRVKRRGISEKRRTDQKNIERHLQDGYVFITENGETSFMNGVSTGATSLYPAPERYCSPL
jgi:hypothetical protein